MNGKENKDGKIFNLKPQLTLAMKLAASFAITYYAMLLLYNILALFFFHYSLDYYYYDDTETFEGESMDLFILIIGFVFSSVLVYSLIQILRKKKNGKIIFVTLSLFLILFQFFTTGFDVWFKYALEIFLVLIIAPIRIQKKWLVKKEAVASSTDAEENKIT
jgi:hypothetical protein